jgi:hypothetical protein
VTTYSPLTPADEGSALAGARHTDNSRLEAFSDAIFGFAATLLVVSLDVPSSFDALVTNLYGFAAFGLSFAALVSIWLVHRDFFRRYPLGDTRIVILNTLLLFVVLFFIYPLKFLARVVVIMFLRGHYRGEAVQIGGSQVAGMFIIYGIGWAAVFGCFALMYAHASRRAEVIDFGPDDVRVARDRAGQYVVMALVGLVSVCLACLGIGVRYGVPGWSYALIGPALTLYWSWRRRGESAS